MLGGPRLVSMYSSASMVRRQPIPTCLRLDKPQRENLVKVEVDDYRYSDAKTRY